MNPLALDLNEQLSKAQPQVADMLSDLGKLMYYPKGILSQSAEAKKTKYNATIGMATYSDRKMYADSLYNAFNELEPDDIFPYAPPQGLEELRDLWKDKVQRDNPELNPNDYSRPIVTNALTHGLSLVGDMFVDTNDTILLPNHNWGNYKLIFSTRHSAQIETYPIFDDNGNFTTQGLVEALDRSNQEKIFLILNYPNNPTGYTPNKDEVKEIVNAIDRLSKRGTNVIAVVDDAYFGLFYEDVYPYSLFTALTQLDSEHVLPIRLDGATKELFAWGFRVGFITFGISDQKAQEVLEAKIKGLIRSNISSGPMPTQSIVKHVLENKDQLDRELQRNFETLKARYEVTKDLVYQDQYQSCWQPYDFNSGYFMALQVKGVDAEELRVHLINKYSIGVVALNDKDIRIAFSCVEKEDLQYVFDSIAQAINDLQ
ncbi:aminotransferase class I/II-fold pyridoxal phosphate-dependent enzyme [Staphylococcus sp. SQ8-PEA]|uniref:Aminotransferase class I/II-fold pyridoxal phosphate-dependent enzyme n=1 Tax=Staphylococcus marylandisciuri TaxID=2981529 RepID=A0ABT2QQD9_9STAP|nr:aminotransferase class I/II-fold pyridoxal phosphate-dependent enzyme [Staphylococcus marylandisciuri]MCU5746172.1 aminotransferase class I/II-fold pyridoxal phosphate-dependent enzyme [Staphylococcus marylandisciuri]